MPINPIVGKMYKERRGAASPLFYLRFCGRYSDGFVDGYKTFELSGLSMYIGEVDLDELLRKHAADYDGAVAIYKSAIGSYPRAYEFLLHDGTTGILFIEDFERCMTMVDSGDNRS